MGVSRLIFQANKFAVGTSSTAIKLSGFRVYGALFVIGISLLPSPQYPLKTNNKCINGTSKFIVAILLRSRFAIAKTHLSIFM
ncbi:hypothetical protein [Nostoc sp. ChiVER01]|uniref:hypothetical protein n=1 Tax=Nostoc sp. ChiVER01 TaxID=3075382 RepID=UPI002AD2380D|nr:hypothetical protein [Nostoc sp. ChiVER01]MDZ8224508.1 hypothetical protein [Nostoc sp. ChiVER01]